MLTYLTQGCQILEKKKKLNLFEMKINFGHFIHPKAKYLQKGPVNIA